MNDNECSKKLQHIIYQARKFGKIITWEEESDLLKYVSKLEKNYIDHLEVQETK